MCTLFAVTDNWKMIYGRATTLTCPTQPHVISYAKIVVWHCQGQSCCPNNRKRIANGFVTQQYFFTYSTWKLRVRFSPGAQVLVTFWGCSTGSRLAVPLPPPFRSRLDIYWVKKIIILIEKNQKKFFIVYLVSMNTYWVQLWIQSLTRFYLYPLFKL